MPDESNLTVTSADKTRARRLFRSTCVSMAVLVIGLGILALTANAAIYNAVLNTAGITNWTATGVWTCSTAGGGDTCGTYPGQLTTPFIDSANVGGTGTLALTSSLPNPISINTQNGLGNLLLVFSGGVMTLTGSSQVTGTSGGTTFLNNGGIITNNGTVTVTSTGPAVSFGLAGGTLNGTGTTSIGPGGTFALGGTQGPMTIDSQTVINGGNLSYTSSANSLTLSTGATISNTTGGSASVTGTAPIIGSAPALISNAGNFFNGGGTIASLNIPFQNTSTAATSVTNSQFLFNGGSGPTGHNGATWNFGPINGQMAFGGAHVFNGTETFSGAGTLTVRAGGAFTVNTTAPTMTIPNTINVSSFGAIDFGTTTHTLALGGTYTQNAAASLQPKLGPTVGVSDAVNVTGAATLGGTLQPGYLAPYSAATVANGDTFTVMTCTPCSGTFTYTPLAYTNGVFLPTYTGTAVQLVAVPIADLSITKTASPTTINDGQNSTFTITVSNAGPSIATTVSVTDNFSGGTFVSATPSQGSCTGTTSPFTCSLGSIASGGSATISVVLTGNAPGTMSNTASATVSPETDPTLPDTATANVTVNPSADLSLAKSATPSPVTAGAALTYGLTVSNAGPDGSGPITVTDTLPAGTTFVSATGTGWSCSQSAGVVTCSGFASVPLAAATSAPPISIVVNAPNAGGSITNNAQVTSATFDPTTPNTASVTTTVNASADLVISKSGPANVTAGQNATYTITVTNNGPSTSTGIVVNDLTPAGTTFVSNTGACTTAFPCSIGSLANGASATITSTFAVASSATGSITNNADVTAATADPTTPNTATTTATVVQSTDFEVLKSGPATATPGTNVTYTVTVKNLGPSDATSAISVSDPTPAGLTFVSNSGGCTTAYPCSVGPLTAGAFVTISSTYAIPLAAGGTTVTNTASIPLVATDPNSANNAASVTTTIASVSADLAISKSAPSTIVAGGAVQFTITVMNNGPANATNVVVNDSPSGGLTFVSNTGACTTPFPCTIASLPAGSSVMIGSIFNVGATVSSISNTASVSSTATTDSVPGNNSSTVTRTIGPQCPTGTPVIFSPFDGQTDVPVSGTLQWTNFGASTYDVYFGPAGSGCNTKVATVTGTSFSFSGLTASTAYEARVVGNKSGCPSVSSVCISFTTAGPACALAAPVLQSPANGASVPSPVTFQWQAVTGAASYHIIVAVNGSTATDTTTSNTSLTVTVPNGNVTWTVTALSGNCASPSSSGTFSICSPPPAPLAGVVGAPSSGSTYSVVVFNRDPNTTKYEFQEANNDQFTNATSQTSSSPAMAYSHSVTTSAQVFFYRVRAFTACSNIGGPFSKTVRVVIVPATVTKSPNVDIPAGTKTLVTIQVLIPGQNQPVAFTASADKPWVVKIDPSSGTLPPGGITLNVTVDPSQLPNGTFTATIIVTTTSLSNSKLITNGTTTTSTTLSINLVTPVVPVDPSAPTADTLIIPAVGHLTGINSQWRSDIRVFNPSTNSVQYLLNFVSSASSDVKQTTIDTAPGATTALDDIIHNWYGFGEVGDNASGVLEVRPVIPTGQSSALSAIVSSRTYNLSPTGTLGQFIPAVPFASFVGAGSRLSLQQVSQSANYRTNFGLVEAAGLPANVVLSMFDPAGNKLFALPVSLTGGSQQQLNGLLSQQGITSLSDGRMEVQVTGGDGKITAYASVVDNNSLDPLFVPGTPLGGTAEQLYVVPGIADLNNTTASWRSDVRVFNSGAQAQTASLTFYPEGQSVPLSASLTINPNEVKVLDNILPSLFSTQNAGGALHIDTPGGSNLIVTARTYNQTAGGTLGQFIPAATPDDGIDRSGRALNILQVEDSIRYRTNVGLAEMSGKAATVEISVVEPDSKVTPTVQVPLGANEFRQFPLSVLGLGDIYNVRVSLRVVDGDGRVTAYGSVIDQATTAPTYIAAQ